MKRNIASRDSTSVLLEIVREKEQSEIARHLHTELGGILSLMLIQCQDQQGHALVRGVGGARRYLSILPPYRNCDGFDLVQVFKA